MRFFFHIAYNGNKYHGWQRQLHHQSIQQTIEEGLSNQLKSKIIIHGCGRTDSKVHADQYLFHVDVEKKWEFDLVFRLNKLLPNDISIYEIIPVENNHHAQRSAVQRTYDYYIHTDKSPFIHTISSYYEDKNLNLEKMQKLVSLLTKHTDYRGFCKSPNKYNHTICNVSSATLFTNKNGDKLRFQVSSNRFLHGMIRAIVARIIQIGTGKISLDEFENYLASKCTHDNLSFAHPQGLHLTKIVYPFLDLPTRNETNQIFQSNGDISWHKL